MTRGLIVEIDGCPVEIERAGVECISGEESFYVMGHDVNGRRCRVSQHWAPAGALDRPGRWRTSGHAYEVRHREGGEE